ncbi:hypothetical protein DDE83_004479 [Stemphylium lycopersici]|uniref:Uncharacterized protein n=1 Tax=Stemphylium lycopersici TaxID=183478 RepID=A0A364N4Z6_STELY|nr:hypothetical protein DDE83_004479 [Stemphylium lycopersici]
MSNLSSQKNTQDIPTISEPTAIAIESARPTSAPITTFSKPIHVERPPSANRNSVGAQELQARIKAARRSRAAVQPLPEEVRRKLDRSSNLIHPALRARSGVQPNVNRTLGHKCKTQDELSIDAVIRRLSIDANGKTVGNGSRLPVSGDIPPVPALPAYPPAATSRPRVYQTASSRSSMTKRRSPLSNVSCPDDPVETSPGTSRRTSTSASSRSSRSDEIKETDEDEHEMIRVISSQTHKPNHGRRKSETVTHSTPSSSQPRVAARGTHFHDAASFAPFND